MSEFNLNTAKVSDLGDTVESQAKAYLDAVDEVTAIVNDLATVWGGPTYDTFKASYDSNLGNLEELNTVLREMASKINDTAAQGEQMINSINNMVGQ